MSTDSITADLTRSANGRIAKERLYHWLLFSCAALTVFVTLGIVVTLAADAVKFFEQVNALEFFTGTTWESSRGTFGVLPLVTATLTVTVVSAVVAIPIGTAAAVYLSEYADERMRSVLKPALEILAGIPTVVYGYIALMYLTPWLEDALRTVGVELDMFNLLSASIMVGVMIIPMVSSISEDAMNAVPDSLRQAGYGMGATKYEVSTGIVIPASLSGIISSYILAFSRAIGETMIVVMAGGMQARMFDMTDPFANLFQSGETMTAAMVHAVTSDATGGSPEYYSMFAIGLTLFFITFAMNLFSNRIAARYREEYQ